MPQETWKIATIMFILVAATSYAMMPQQVSEDIQEGISEAIPLGDTTISLPDLPINGESPPEPEPANYTSLTTQEAFHYWQIEFFTWYIDVRSQSACLDGHIPYTDYPLDHKCIPLNDLLAGGESSIINYKESPILVYCQTGVSSVSASEYLVEKGFTNIYNMEGGWSGWLAEGYEISYCPKCCDP